MYHTIQKATRNAAQDNFKNAVVRHPKVNDPCEKPHVRPCNIEPHVSKTTQNPVFFLLQP